MGEGKVLRLPAFVEDADEDEPDFEPDVGANVGADDFPDEQLEDGDRIWATGLLPEPEYIRASSTISQRLVGAFKWNSEPPDYEKHIPVTCVTSIQSSPRSVSMTYPNPSHGTMQWSSSRMQPQKVARSTRSPLRNRRNWTPFSRRTLIQGGSDLPSPQWLPQ